MDAANENRRVRRILPKSPLHNLLVGYRIFSKNTEIVYLNILYISSIHVQYLLQHLNQLISTMQTSGDAFFAYKLSGLHKWPLQVLGTISYT